MMATAGLILGMLAFFGTMVGCIPFLGWLNWFNVLVGCFGLMFSGFANSRSRPEQNGTAIAGIVLSLLAIVLGTLRLKLGCGII
jgi:hypothetical protein